MLLTLLLPMYLIIHLPGHLILHLPPHLIMHLPPHQTVHLPLPPRSEALERGGLGQEEDLGQLVLSPQRRSFLSGCAAAPGEAGVEVSLRPEVSLGEVWWPGRHLASLTSLVQL